MSIPEIADDYYQIDDAIRTGYAWSYGPFEIWDNLGVETGIEMIRSCGEEVPNWVLDMSVSGAESFYKFEDGKKKFYDAAVGGRRRVGRKEKVEGGKQLFCLGYVGCQGRGQRVVGGRAGERSARPVRRAHRLCRERRDDLPLRTPDLPGAPVLDDDQSAAR